MGNTGNNGGRRQNRDNRDQQQQQRQNYPSPSYPQTSDRPQQTEIPGGRYVFAAGMPYPNPYSHAQMQNPNMQTQNFLYHGYYPPSVPFPLPYDGQRHHQRPHDPSVVGSWAGYPGRHHRSNACHVTHASTPYVEHQKAVTIRNDVNVKKETLCMVPDEDNQGQFLASFTFDATVAGRISIFFFAKEGNGCSLTSLKEDQFHPVTIPFEEGLGQKFRQPSGTGIDFCLFEEVELTKGDMDVFPLAVKAEASPTDEDGKETVLNSQITQAVFEKKENDNYHVKVIKQILWVNSTRYELQEIYGIGNSVANDFDGSEQGKECVICLSEPRDTTVLPCRHMCMCSECAQLLQYQTNRCPICRQPVEGLLEINVKNDDSEA